MPKKSSKTNPFIGVWNISSMTEWGDDFVNEEFQAFIQFEDNGQGEFQIGYVHGYLDCRRTDRNGDPAVEWTWDGNDDMESVHGRGWCVLNGTEMQGMIFFHRGEESGFVAKKSKRKLS